MIDNGTALNSGKVTRISAVLKGMINSRPQHDHKIPLHAIWPLRSLPNLNVNTATERAMLPALKCKSWLPATGETGKATMVYCKDGEPFSLGNILSLSASSGSEWNTFNI